jgi:hypothetical protein
MDYVYGGEKYGGRMTRFLNATMGKALVLMDDEKIAIEHEDYEEFEADLD